MEHCETIKELYDVTHNNKNEYLEERENILMQFTWLTDKNGKEIYEGDIVFWKDYKYKKWIITWITDLEYCWFVPREVGKDSLSHFISWGNLEVIWNIYENPDLLFTQK